MRMLIHTIGGTHEVDLSDLVSIEIDTDAARLFDLIMIDDHQAILRVQGEALDLGYLTTWAARLGIAELWAAARRRDRAPHLATTDEPPRDDDPRQTRMDI